MRWLRGAFGVTALLALAAATSVSAQRRPIELGLDALLAWHNPDGAAGKFLSIDLPMGGLASLAPINAFRAGFFLTDNVSIEPSVGFSMFDDDEETMSHFGFSSSLLLQPYAEANRAMPFLGLGGNYNWFDLGADGKDSQFGLQGFAGVRLPVVNNLAVRLTAGGGRFFESGDMEARWTAFGTLGLSFWPGERAAVSASR